MYPNVRLSCFKFLLTLLVSLLSINALATEIKSTEHSENQVTTLIEINDPELSEPDIEYEAWVQWQQLKPQLVTIENRRREVNELLFYLNQLALTVSKIDPTFLNKPLDEEQLLLVNEANQRIPCKIFLEQFSQIETLVKVEDIKTDREIRDWKQVSPLLKDLTGKQQQINDLLLRLTGSVTSPSDVNISLN